MSLKIQRKKEPNFERCNHHGQNDEVEPTGTITKSLSERINASERSFALCDFKSALAEANEILEAQTSASSSSTLNEVLNSQAHSLVYDLRLSNLPGCSTDSDGDKTQSDEMFAVSVVINLRGNQESSIRERASAVAIQSSYELWKRRNGDVIDEELQLNLVPFLSSYNPRKSTIEPSEEKESAPDFAEYQSFMTLELAALYIHFCHAIGLYQSTIASILQIFAALIDIDYKSLNGCVDLNSDDSSTAGFDEGETSHDDLLYNFCSEVLNLLLVQTLPRLKDIRIVESITDVIFTIVQNQREGDQMKHNIDESCAMWNNLKMSSTHEKASVAVMCRNMEAIIICEEGKLPSYLREAMQDALLDVKELIARDNVADDGSVDDAKSSISSAIERTTKRLTIDTGEDNRVEYDAYGHEKGGIMYYLWESDDRWLNRGKVVAVGLLSYSAWTRRRRLYGSTRSIGRALLSPVREIVNAIASPK